MCAIFGFFHLWTLAVGIPKINVSQIKKKKRKSSLSAVMVTIKNCYIYFRREKVFFLPFRLTELLLKGNFKYLIVC